MAVVFDPEWLYQKCVKNFCTNQLWCNAKPRKELLSDLKFFPLSPLACVLKGFFFFRGKYEMWTLPILFSETLSRGWALLCDRSAVGTSAERSPAATKNQRPAPLHGYFRKCSTNSWILPKNPGNMWRPLAHQLVLQNTTQKSGRKYLLDKDGS